jgi:hypothetical protein
MIHAPSLFVRAPPARILAPRHVPLSHIRQIPGIDGIVSAVYDVPVGEVWLGQAALDAGASFLVSPGTPEGLLQFAAQCAPPFLPGAATVAELMRPILEGCTAAKVFPVESLGGASPTSKRYPGPSAQLSYAHRAA